MNIAYFSKIYSQWLVGGVVARPLGEAFLFRQWFVHYLLYKSHVRYSEYRIMTEEVLEDLIDIKCEVTWR